MVAVGNGNWVDYRRQVPWLVDYVRIWPNAADGDFMQSETSKVADACSVIAVAAHDEQKQKQK